MRWENWFKQTSNAMMLTALLVPARAVGNGRLGGMVFGGVESERLQLNEVSVWSGSPQDSDNPEALAALPRV